MALAEREDLADGEELQAAIERLRFSHQLSPIHMTWQLPGSTYENSKGSGPSQRILATAAGRQ